jgi:hypothetical protein
VRDILAQVLLVAEIGGQIVGAGFVFRRRWPGDQGATLRTVTALVTHAGKISSASSWRRSSWRQRTSGKRHQPRGFADSKRELFFVMG